MSTLELFQHLQLYLLESPNLDPRPAPAAARPLRRLRHARQLHVQIGALLHQVDLSPPDYLYLGLAAATAAAELALLLPEASHRPPDQHLLAFTRDLVARPSAFFPATPREHYLRFTWELAGVTRALDGRQPKDLKAHTIRAVVHLVLLTDVTSALGTVIESLGSRPETTSLED